MSLSVRIQEASDPMLRFILSPMADLHVDALRVALINALVAQQQDKAFLLRIEDHNETQSTLAAESRHILEKFAIHHDHIFYQSESRHRHQQLAISLLERDKAFLCTCSAQTDRCDGPCRLRTQEELNTIRDHNISYCLRANLPESPIVFTDTIHGEIVAQPHDIGEVVILEADGTPSVTFAMAVDDMLNNIAHVIQCQEHLPRTSKQLHLHQLLDYTKATSYTHIPPILSNTKPATSLTVPLLLQEGYLPDAILNYLLLPDEQTPPKVFTLPEAVNTFQLEAIPSTPRLFSRDTLRELNREHIRRMDPKALSRLYHFADDDIGRLIQCYLDEAATLAELDEKIRPLLAPKSCTGEIGERMRALSGLIIGAPYFEQYDDFVSYLLTQTGWRPSELSLPLRQLITGADHGPALGRLYPFIRSYITEVARCQP